MGVPFDLSMLKPGVVNIDPGHKEDGGFSIDLSQLDEDSVREALAESYKSAKNNSDLGFKTFKKLAESQKKPRTIGAAASSKTGLPAVIERNQQVSRPASFSTKNKITNEDIAALVSDEVASDEEMLSYTTPRTKKLNPSKIFEGARNVATKVKNPNIATQGPPTVKVTFELDGFGTIETCYHKVVQGDDGVSLVLVYDNSYIGGTKFFPPSSDNDLYVDVHNMNQVFKVKSTGMHYRVDNQEHYILLIEQAKLKDEEE
jgi:hypothetical protein